MLEAEQHLLRIKDFDTRNEQKIGFVMLMSYLQYLQWSVAASQLAFTVYNDLSFLQTTAKQHKSYNEYFRKAREVVWGCLRASYVVGVEIAGLTFPKPVDEHLLNKFALDTRKIESKRSTYSKPSPQRSWANMLRYTPTTTWSKLDGSE